MLLIQKGVLYTMDAEKPFQGDLLIKDGKIAQIACEIPPSQDMEVICAEGMSVYPGFIDAHSHIGISEEKKTGNGDE